MNTRLFLQERIDQADCIITEEGAPANMMAALREAGVDVIIA